jgi:hypothetical protein
MAFTFKYPYLFETGLFAIIVGETLNAIENKKTTK